MPMKQSKFVLYFFFHIGPDQPLNLKTDNILRRNQQFVGFWGGYLRQLIISNVLGSTAFFFFVLQIKVSHILYTNSNYLDVKSFSILE